MVDKSFGQTLIHVVQSFNLLRLCVLLARFLEKRMSIVAPQSKSNLTSSPVWIRRCPGQRGFVAAISWQSRGQKNFCKATLVEKKNEQKRQHGVFKSCQKWKNKIQNAFTRHIETFISTNATKLINVPQKWRLLISINMLTTKRACHKISYSAKFQNSKSNTWQTFPLLRI